VSTDELHVALLEKVLYFVVILLFCAAGLLLVRIANWGCLNILLIQECMSKYRTRNPFCIYFKV
jgi:hypothetical protein